MRARILPVLSLSTMAFWSLRCGPISTGNIGVPSSDGGSGAAAPGADAGASDAGSTSGGDDGGSGGNADAGSGGNADAGSGGSGDGGAGGSADGGTSASECDGLSPDVVGAPTATHTMQGYQVDCGAAVDALGTLALWTSNALAPENGTVDFVGADGKLRSNSGAGVNAFLSGRYSTFEGLIFTGHSGSESYALGVWDDQGNNIYTGPSRAGNFRWTVDPLGGIAVMSQGGGGRALENYDDHGNLRWTATLTSNLTAIGAFVVDRLGNTFVMGDSSSFDKSVVAQWIDHQGNAGEAFTALGPQSNWSHLEGWAFVRVGGGVFFRGDQWWQLEPMSTSVAPAPAWVRQREASSAVMVRGGRAYGFISPGSALEPQCLDKVEVVAPSGRSCGTAAFNAGPPGTGCWSSPIIGYDGTLVQRVPPPEGLCTGGTCSCTWQWWTGFFQ